MITGSQVWTVGRIGSVKQIHSQRELAEQGVGREGRAMNGGEKRGEGILLRRVVERGAKAEGGKEEGRVSSPNLKTKVRTRPWTFVKVVQKKSSY